MKLEQGKFCPLIGEDCWGLKCAWFTQVRGVNPQTGQEIDEWGCAITWMPMLMIENSQQQRQTGAAVESFRNESVKSSEASNQLFAAALQQRAALQQKPINTIEQTKEP
tara:strand:+ start:1104 stop:1430 length:327 start_codon:yes stop_codon:yes gene_type:complete